MFRQNMRIPFHRAFFIYSGIEFGRRWALFVDLALHWGYIFNDYYYCRKVSYDFDTRYPPETIKCCKLSQFNFCQTFSLKKLTFPVNLRHHGTSQQKSATSFPFLPPRKIKDSPSRLQKQRVLFSRTSIEESTAAAFEMLSVSVARWRR